MTHYSFSAVCGVTGRVSSLLKSAAAIPKRFFCGDVAWPGV